MDDTFNAAYSFEHTFNAFTDSRPIHHLYLPLNHLNFCSNGRNKPVNTVHTWNTFVSRNAANIDDRCIFRDVI